MLFFRWIIFVKTINQDINGEWASRPPKINWRYLTMLGMFWEINQSRRIGEAQSAARSGADKATEAAALAKAI